MQEHSHPTPQQIATYSMGKKSEERKPLSSALEEQAHLCKVTDPCILVIFGATGDLTARKLFPALYNLAREKQLSPNFACVGFARRDKSDAVFRQEMHDAVSRFSRSQPIDESIWGSFANRISYHLSDFDQDEGYLSLKKQLDALDQQFGTKGNRVFYLSTQPKYFPDIVERLKKHNLIYDPAQEKERWSRVIIEKPFGHDYASALDLQRFILNHLDESQIYRIDHYLGKETVQNLLVFRFANSLFEAFWNHKYVDHVQITVGEDIGIGTRGAFFEEAGIVRDIIQNHMIQLLSLIAMEPPSSLEADRIRDEKVKLTSAIRPIDLNCAVRGQYGPGVVQNEQISGYRQEPHVNPNSSVETYAAFELYIDNWRWAGVPFYLRAGKRLPKRDTEIAIVFKEVPQILFGQGDKKLEPNVLVVRVQPNEGISLRINSKVPGTGNLIQPVKMDFSYSSYFGLSPPEAYERLICDCMLGDGTLFARGDEVLTSWKLFTPILEHWQKTPPTDFPNYAAGTWGPKAADELLLKKGHAWRNF